MNYYNYIIIITWFTLGGLCVLVAENDRIAIKGKKSFYLTYAIIAFAALAEWLGLKFNGNTAIPVWLLRTVKCADYILTPIAGGALVAQLYGRGVFRKVMQIALLINLVFQLVCVFTDWMIIVDENNVYSHGALYGAYIGLYALVIAIVVIELFIYGNKFRKQNRASLIYIVLFVVAGIMVQELSNGEFRTSYISLAIGVALLFIHNVEFYQLETDDMLHKQRIKVMLAQIQPHFIYNALSAISGIDGVPEKAQDAITDFSRFLRENLDSLTGSDLVPFERELSHIEKYVALEQLRFGDRVKVNFDIKNKDFLLPPLTVQMLVENAIKHGITKKYEGGTVNITTEKADNTVVITVQDDGVGFDAEKIVDKKHIGIRSIKNRLIDFVGGTLKIESKIGLGTTATVIIPEREKNGKGSKK